MTMMEIRILPPFASDGSSRDDGLLDDTLSKSMIRKVSSATVQCRCSVKGKGVAGRIVSLFAGSGGGGIPNAQIC